jgi:hypothetical protein
MRRVAARCSAWLLHSTIAAQEQLAIRSDFLFYGDNTEFSNPFRKAKPFSVRPCASPPDRRTNA